MIPCVIETFGIGIGGAFFKMGFGNQFIHWIFKGPFKMYDIWY